MKIINVIAGVVIGVLFVILGILMGVLASMMIDSDPALDKIDTVISMVSHDIENVVDNVKGEVEHQIWRVENTAKVQDVFGEDIAEIFWDLTR